MPNIFDVVNKHEANFRSIKMTKHEEAFNLLLDGYAQLNDKSEVTDKEVKKKFYSFSQIAGLQALDQTWFKEIVDEKALSFLSKYRNKISFNLGGDYDPNSALLISGIAPNEVKEVINFFEKNIEQYSKYQYFTKEIDYDLEDGVIYDITDIDSTQDIVNIIIYFS